MHYRLFRLAFVLLLASFAGASRAQQVSIPRVEQMPNLPDPYEMRDWRRVALGFDTLAFDLGRQGPYLPLVWIDPTPVNYPEHPTFGLDTYVGTSRVQSAEAINVLPALVGATLVGVDKREQHGRDWVLMAQEFFNRRPEENVYLNGPSSRSGSDWWYDTMPNVFFYQLYDLYPGTGDFAFQFRSVADRWLEAVRRMGGSAAPWQVPEMNYRGWRLSTMTPNTQGVPEPEAAGALAWLLYHAYVETGEDRYRVGAEWAMEFLDGFPTNPSYELQLPYGAYVAARMNAELGTRYDIEQLLEWCFEMGPLRQWGTIVGRWGGYDVHGLVGEARGFDDYAFAMNSFEQVGALVPLVRYDDRFARTIGKYALNAANAARLFYTNYLPDENQDSDAWAHAHDPFSYLAHEAMRQSRFGRSPYATGDAIDGGWAQTNLALYGSSHVGLLGGIVDTTDVEGILRLDVRRTDFFQDAAYPTYLLYNPYEEARTVTFDAGPDAVDLYDAASNAYLQRNVSGPTPLTIPADAAVLVVRVPSGGAETFDVDRLLVDGVVVDYRSGRAVANRAPRVKAVGAAPATVLRGSTAALYCTAEDTDGNALAYTWTASAGTIEGDGVEAAWTAPQEDGAYTITCTVADPSGAEAALAQTVMVATTVPVVDAVSAAPPRVDLGGRATLTCTAHDPGAAELTYTWSATAGLVEGDGPEVDWTAPEVEGTYVVTCRAANAAGGEAEGQAAVYVRDFDRGDAGRLMLHLPFDGDAADVSGFGRPVTVAGAQPATDPWGRAGRALRFDGRDDHVRVANAPDLNFEGGITLSFWMDVAAFYTREAFVLSHGSWEQRWKVSISNERLRWTVKTDRGVRDLDSGRLDPSRFYHVVVRYDGRDLEIYFDDELEAFATFEGRLLPSTHDLMVGQHLPNSASYNFAGTVDGVRLYDGALSVRDVGALFAASTSRDEERPAAASLRLDAPYPNPFDERTTLRFALPTPARVSARIYDLLGRRVRTLVDADLPAGAHELAWDGTGEAGQRLAAGVYVVELAAGAERHRRTVVRLR